MNQTQITSFSQDNIFDALMKFYLTISEHGIASLIPYSSYLIALFGIIDIATSWYLYDGSIKMTLIVQKVMKLGAFIFMVTHWSYLISIIGRSFSFIGYVAGGHTAQEALQIIGKCNDNSMATMFNPSYIMDQAGNVAKPVWEAYEKTSGFSFGRILMELICLALIYIGFYFMCLQLILTNIEFAIFTCLAIVLLPFGCIKYTSFLSQRAISGVFSFGIKLMVLYFLLGIIGSLGDAFKQEAATTPPDKNVDSYSYLLKQGLAYLSLGYLTWKIPGMAASMMNGTPSLGDGVTPGTMIGAPFAAAKMGGKVLGGVSSFAGSQAAKIGQAYNATKAGATASAGESTPSPSIPSPATNNATLNAAIGSGAGGEISAGAPHANGPATMYYGSTDAKAMNASTGNNQSSSAVSVENNTSKEIPISTGGRSAGHSADNQYDRSDSASKGDNAVKEAAKGGSDKQSTLSQAASDPFLRRSMRLARGGVFAARFAGNYARELGKTLLMVNPIAKGFRRGAQNAAQTQDAWDRYKQYATGKNYTDSSAPKGAPVESSVLNTLGSRNPAKDDPNP